MPRLIGIGRLLHRLSGQYLLSRDLPRELLSNRELPRKLACEPPGLDRIRLLHRLLGLIGIRFRCRRLLHNISATAASSPASPGSDDTVARPSRRHVQWIGRLRIGIVGIVWLG